MPREPDSSSALGNVWNVSLGVEWTDNLDFEHDPFIHVSTSLSLFFRRQCPALPAP